MCLSIDESLHLSVSSVSLPICASAHLCVCPSVSFSSPRPGHLNVRGLISQASQPSVHLSIYPSIQSLVCPVLYLSNLLFMYYSVWVRFNQKMNDCAWSSSCRMVLGCNTYRSLAHPSSSSGLVGCEWEEKVAIELGWRERRTMRW